MRNVAELGNGRKERLAKLSAEMQVRPGEFELGLHGVRDDTKQDYLGRMVSFGSFLMGKGKRSFEKAERQDIDLFLSSYLNPATKNVFIAVFRHFYAHKAELITHLKVYEIDLEEITPFRSRCLTTHSCSCSHSAYGKLGTVEVLLLRKELMSRA